MEKEKNRKNLMIIAVVGFLLFSVIAIILAIIDGRKSATLDLLVAPSSATITIDGKTYKNGTYRFVPGEIKVIISKEGFKTEEKTVALEANVTTKLYTYIMPIDGSFEWYLQHEDEQLLLNTIGDNEASEASASYLEKYPVVNELPIVYANYDKEYNYTEFRIDGGMFDGCKKDFCLKITDTTGGNRDAALEMLKKRGVDVDDYEIIYEYVPIEEL